MAQKIIVITGASGGVGQMLSIGLAKKGNHIVCLGRNKEKLLNLVTDVTNQCAHFGGSASTACVDMTDSTAVKAVGKAIVEEFGRIDIWINNVGVNEHNAIGPSWEIKAEHWWSEVSSNLFTAYLGSATAVNTMKKNDIGYIINLGGGGVQRAKPYGSAYGSAKTAIVKFTETLSLELLSEKLPLKTFTINPGFIRNERTERLVESEVCKTYMPRLGTTLKNGKMSNIEDSIALIEILCSGRADAFSGGYFLADDRNIEELLEHSDECIRNKMNLLHLKQ